MNITAQQLKAIIPNIEANIKANRYTSQCSLQYVVDVLNKYAKEYGIDIPDKRCSRLRWAHFLANVAVESGGFKHTEENLNYSAKGLLTTFPRYFTTLSAEAYARKPQLIANKVYGHRMGNGGEETGDGWRYRGRGYIQLTGKCNYNYYGIECPDKLLELKGAVAIAMEFFKKNGLLALCDTDAGLLIRKKINGGTNGWKQCQEYIVKAKKVL